jgi:hypothetical protein
MKLLIAVSLLLLCLPSQAEQSSCQNGDFAADGLVTRWDKYATDHKFSDWLLKKYNGLGFIRQQLGKSGLLLVGQVDKHRCVTRLEIKSRRADADGYAALELRGCGSLMPQTRRRQKSSAMKCSLSCILTSQTLAVHSSWGA